MDSTPVAPPPPSLPTAIDQAVGLVLTLGQLLGLSIEELTGLLVDAWQDARR